MKRAMYIVTLLLVVGSVSFAGKIRNYSDGVYVNEKLEVRKGNSMYLVAAMNSSKNINIGDVQFGTYVPMSNDGEYMITITMNPNLRGSVRTLSVYKSIFGNIGTDTTVDANFNMNTRTFDASKEFTLAMLDVYFKPSSAAVNKMLKLAKQEMK